MSLLELFHWLAHTSIGIAMRDSTWGFAIVEIGHLIALAAFGGAIILVDLRFVGLMFKKQPAPQIARELLPIAVIGVVSMAVTGFLLLVSGPLRYYYNPAFRIKMWLFPIALIFHFWVQIRVGRNEPEHQELPSRWLKIAGAASLLLWIGIGLAGRAIGYV